MSSESKGQSLETYVIFRGKLWSEQAEALKETFTNLSIEGVKRVKFLIDSPGGGLQEAFTVYAHLKSLDIEIETHNLGSVHSSAHVIYQVGNNRTASSESKFMLHGMLDTKARSAATISALLLTEPTDELKASLDLVQLAQKMYDQFLVEHTDLSASQLKEYHGGERYMIANQAVQLGIADGIMEIDLPKGVQIIEVNGG